MKASLALFAAIALFPAMADGAMAATGGEGPLALALCSGGTFAINLGPASAPPLGAAPCCAKGCRSDDRKRRFDIGQ